MSTEHITGAEIDQWVAVTARSCGWLVLQCPKTVPGQGSIPDLLVFRGPEKIAVKVMTIKAARKGPSAAQTEWLDALAEAGFEPHVWTPDHFAAAHDRLRHPIGPPDERETAAEDPLP